MANPVFPGNVNIDVFFGTKFDDFNVPFDSDMIVQQATKRITLNSNVVWQTTWLSTIILNIQDYQEIVGAQYVRIGEVNSEYDHGYHWYSVLGYVMKSNKSVELGLLYDALLSIGIGHIAQINGTIKRWSVNDDSHFNYVMSDEPINQIDDFDYTYFRYNPVNTSGEGATAIAGFPYDMKIKPEILTYFNSDGQTTNIPYPNMKLLDKGTDFVSATGGGILFNDGMMYYFWPAQVPYEVFQAAIGLGLELASQSYMLPNSPLVAVDLSSTPAIPTITGLKATVNSGFGLYENGYNNAKAGDIGTDFSLYNEISGESVTIKNYDLSDTSIDVSVNPYATGNFYARFTGYYKDNNGFSGYVKSAGFQPFSLKANVGIGQATNYLANRMDIDSANVGYNAQLASMMTERENQAVSYAAGGISDVVSGAASFATMAVNPLAVSGIINSAASLANRTVDLANYNRTFDTNLSNLEMNRSLQRNQLSVKGSLGQIKPPMFKLANSYNLEGNAYSFVVKKSSISARDREKADRFFTAYGYNVDALPLNDVNQLQTRERFTFIVADDVNILAVSGSTSLTRLRDSMSIQQIRNRFSSGLRIWKTEPNYDWSIRNGII